MINLRDQVPSIYTSASRDFQYMCWLSDIVLNYVKHNIDDIYSLPVPKANAKLVELLAMTLGFKMKRNYDQKQLEALVSIFPSILKYKGTEKALTMLGDAIITASGATGSFSYEITDTNVDVVLPEELVDTALFMDILDYILPAGMTCRIRRSTQEEKALDDILVAYSDKIRGDDKLYKDLDWNFDENIPAGLASLFDTDHGTSDFSANFKVIGEMEGKQVFAPNTGLLSNSVIPALDTTVGNSLETLNNDGD